MADLQKEIDALKTKLTASQEKNKAFAEENKALKAENASLKKDAQTPKENSTAIKSKTVTLADGKKVKVNFGVEIPELGKSYSKEEIEANAEVIGYLLEIGSGAISVINKED